jgi:hypothetical protein
MERVQAWLATALLGIALAASRPAWAAEPKEPPLEAEMLRNLDLLKDADLAKERALLRGLRILERLRLLERLGLLESQTPMAPTQTEGR